jgi:ABC-type branched-subunit amino acid transport system ATPase component
MAVEPTLRTVDLHRHFGGIRAVDGVSITINDSEILSVIGPNGAGKTTLFNVLTGVLAPTSGSAEMLTDEGWVELTGHSSDEVARRGLVRTFQNVRPFDNLTVRQNVLAGLGSRRYRTPAVVGRYDTADARETADELLERVGLRGYEELNGGELPLAMQRRLEIARALALDPTILLLDEPAAGLNEAESKELLELLQQLREEGLTIGLVSHTIDLVMNVSDRIYVLDRGEIIAEGDPETIQHSDRVAEAYLGEKSDA